MASIRVSTLPRRQFNARALLAELCWYYPQYTLAAARKLPARDVMLLIKTAHRKEAEQYYHQVNIAAAPHTRDGRGVKTLSDKYKEAAQE